MNACLHRSRSIRPVMAMLALALLGGIPAARAHEVSYSVTLNGPSEAPPNASPGTGTALITFDLDLVTMRVQASFSGLIGNTTASHIHAATAVAGAGTAGVATQLPSFTGFPLGVTSGAYDHTFDMTQAASYNPSYITNHGGTVGQALADFLQACADGKAYLNIHSSTVSSGEIRGFLIPVPVPVENATWGRLKALYP